MEIEDIELSKIKIYDANAKTHPQEQVELIANSIKEFGFKTPIVVDQNFVIIQGHGRRLASIELGLEKVPCVVADDLSDKQVKMLRLADNKVSESEWDFSLLNEELMTVDDDFNIMDFGFELGEIDNNKQEEGEGAKGSLSEKFGIPPFSILNAREGWWQDRKKSWIKLGIKSDEGRDAGLKYYNEGILITPVGTLALRAGRHFEKSRKLGKSHQNILVFIKGDGKKETLACGECDYGEIDKEELEV